MDILLISIAGILMITGILGSIIPVLPGVPVSWLGLLVLHFTAIPISYTFLVITLIISIIILVLQYSIPAYGTKRYGGSKRGMAGAFIGMFVGLIAPIPFGVLIGPFIGAFLGELLNKSNSKTALRAAYGSFIGFLASTFIEFLVTVIFFGIFLYKLWSFRDFFI